MAFTAKKTDNSVAAVVNDYEAAIAGGLQLLGYGYVNYSEEIANNFVRVAENFANVTPPVNPLKGQLWWDTSNNSQPALWVCRDPTAAAAPTTSRWSKVFEVNSQSGQVDAWTLRSYPPSVTSAAHTVVVRGSDGKIAPDSLPTASALSLDGLSDVAVSSPVANQVVKYNGSQFVNEGMTLDQLFDVSTSGAVNGSILKFNGSDWVIGSDLSGGGGGTAAWGDVTGTIGLQTDLMNLFNTHTHSIAQVTNLQTSLDSKLTMAGLLAADGSGSSLDSDLLDGQHGTFYTNLANMTGSLPNTVLNNQYLFNQVGYCRIGFFIIQWGRTFIGDANGTTPVALPLAYPNAHLCAVGNQGSNLDSGDEGDEAIWAVPLSNSQVGIGVDGDFSSTYAYWISIGY